MCAPVLRRRNWNADELSPGGFGCVCDPTATPPVRVEQMQGSDCGSKDSPPRNVAEKFRRDLLAPRPSAQPPQPELRESLPLDPEDRSLERDPQPEESRVEEGLGRLVSVK